MIFLRANYCFFFMRVFQAIFQKSEVKFLCMKTLEFLLKLKN